MPDNVLYMVFSGSNLVDRINKTIDRKGLIRDPDLYNIVPSGTLSAWKNKGQIPRIDKICNIADFLGVSIVWLITGEEAANIDPQTLKMAQDISSLSLEDREDIKVLINHKLSKQHADKKKD